MRTTIVALLLILMAAPVAAGEQGLPMFTLAGPVAEVVIVPAGDGSYFRSVTVSAVPFVVNESAEALEIKVGDCVLVHGLAVILPDGSFYRWAEGVEVVACTSIPCGSS
jgi:hypothetical protein